MTLILSGTNGLSDVDGDASTPAIRGTDANTGMFFGSDIVGLSTDGSERMRITSSGEVLVGGTTEINAVPGAVTIQRTNFAAILSLFRDDTTVSSTNAFGQIRFYGNDTTSNTPTQHAYIQAVASGTHAAGDNPTDLVFGTTPDGSETVAEKMRLTEAGYLRLAAGGIQFNGDTAAGNALDDYEEGTFTPTAVGGTTAGTTTYLIQVGSYTKIGRQVTVTFFTAWSAMTGTGSLILGNLPFTSASISSQNYATGACTPQFLNWGGGTSMVALQYDNTNYAVLVGIADDSDVTTQQVVNETANVRVTLTYFTS